jgi:hypothetical protein
MDDAQEWIGKSQPESDGLDLERILRDVQPAAVALREVLKDAEIEQVAERRARSSRRAAAAQRTFQWLGTSIVWGSAVAALASGLLLYGSGTGQATSTAADPAIMVWAHQNLGAITIAQVIGLFTAAVASAVLAAKDYGQLWTDDRRRAEADRIRLFDVVFAKTIAKDPGTGAGGALRQALEFFRRYQLDLQIGYYRRRAGQHELRNTAIVWATASLAGVAGISGTLATLGKTPAAIAAFLGIAVPILLSAARSWRTLSRASEKAASYQTAGDALAEIKSGLDNARRDADRGDASGVESFVARVHQIIRVENGAWVGSGQLPQAQDSGTAEKVAPAVAKQHSP